MSGESVMKNQNGFALLETIFASILGIILIISSILIVNHYHRSQRTEVIGAEFAKVINTSLQQYHATGKLVLHKTILSDPSVEHYIDISKTISDGMQSVGYPLNQATIEMAAQEVAQLQMGCPYTTTEYPNSITFMATGTTKPPKRPDATDSGHDYYEMIGQDPHMPTQWKGYLQVPHGGKPTLPVGDPQALDGYALLPLPNQLATTIIVGYTGLIPSDVDAANSPAVCKKTYNSNTIIFWYQAQQKAQTYFYCAYQPYTGITPHSQSDFCALNPADKTCEANYCANNPGDTKNCVPISCIASKSQNHCALTCQVPLFQESP